MKCPGINTAALTGFQSAIRPRLVRWGSLAGLMALCLVLASQGAWAQVGVFAPDAPPAPSSLKTVTLPVPANLGHYVVNKQAAIVLGKALFWEEQVGSDGLACASCHFHAGADNRVKNAIDPGLRNAVSAAVGQTYSLTAANRHNLAPAPPGGGPNYTLKKADFPTHQLANPELRNSDVLFDTDDIIGSQGVFNRDFTELLPRDRKKEICSTPALQPIFEVGGVGVRQVEPRNTPTVINAALNFRNFWDGRANNIFNGRNPFGPRDPSAGIDPLNSILVPDVSGHLVPEKVALLDASAASQAVGPILSNLEMSCSNRTFEEVGRKLLAPQLRPLARQEVDRTDSVLGPYRAGGGGLKVSYQQLIQQAFAPKYWHSLSLSPDGYTQMEKNFSLFWGLAIQMYESTLISDDAPFDQYMDGNVNAMTAEQTRGFFVYQGNGGCIRCHLGPEFTSAGVSHQKAAQVQGSQVEHMLMGDGTVSVYDTGWYNIGVRPTGEDLGVGATDPWGNSLSWARQAKRAAGAGFSSVFTVEPDNAGLLSQLFVNTCNFQVEACIPMDGTFRDAVDGAFKVPTLRNVELTGPYFHNGSRATLEQVVEFYKRGGDRRGPDGADTTGFGSQPTNMAPNVFPLSLTPQDEADLVAFLKALTDERVRWERAPFDHPSLHLPNGHPGNELHVLRDPLTGLARDSELTLPAIGAAGRAAKRLPPLLPFDAGLK